MMILCQEDGCTSPATHYVVYLGDAEESWGFFTTYACAAHSDFVHRQAMEMDGRAELHYLTSYEDPL